MLAEVDLIYKFHPLVHGNDFEILELNSITEDNAADTTLNDDQYRAYIQDTAGLPTETARDIKSEMTENKNATTRTTYPLIPTLTCNSHQYIAGFCDSGRQTMVMRLLCLCMGV